MGVEPFLVASSVEGVMAQRLVRRICPDCKVTYQPEESEFPPDFGPHTGMSLQRGSGCRECRNTGYRGRLGIYELLTMTEPIRELILARTNASRIAACAIESGDLTLLRTAGFEKVRAGESTFAEVLRATKG
jgi:general secretion pathway protein E/type IV pilus assembly protein PilB